MAGQTPFFGDFPATGRTLARKRWPWPKRPPLSISIYPPSPSIHAKRRFSTIQPINDPPTVVGQARKDGRTIFSMSRLRSAGSAAQPRGSSRRAKAVNFLTERGLESSKPPYASSSRSLPAASASCTTGCAENTRSAAASEASMPARSFVVGDGVCIVGERAKPTTRARLPKRVRPTHGASSAKKKGGARKEWPVPQ